MIHSAMAIATAVPHVMGSNNSSVSSIPSKLKPDIGTHVLSVSAENVGEATSKESTSSYSIETFSGFEEATSKRVKRVEDRSGSGYNPTSEHVSGE